MSTIEELMERCEKEHVFNILKQKKRVILIGSVNELTSCSAWLLQAGIVVERQFLFPEERLEFEDFLTECGEETAVGIASYRAKAVIAFLQNRGLTAFYNLSGIPEYLEYIPDYFTPAVFAEHCQGINQIAALWQDETSRLLYWNLIWYRLTMHFSPFLATHLWEQYFHRIVQPRQGQVIFDAGARIGDTAQRFAAATKGEARIVAFEPEAENYQAMLHLLQQEQLAEIVMPVQQGVWNCEGTLRFKIATDIKNSGAHQIAEDGEVAIDVTTIDSFVKKSGLVPDLIKMDIEGSEREALAGAELTIRTHKPDLIICLYHKVDDLWVIPQLVHALLPEYKLYLGHHDPAPSETVLYATVRAEDDVVC